MELEKTIPIFDVWMEKVTKIGIFLFLAGFYLMEPGKAHNNIFYILVLLPGLILLYKKYKEIFNNKIIFYFSLCLLYYAISSLWGDSADFLPALKYCIYITVFMWVFSYLIYSDKLYKNIILNSLPLIAAFSVIVNAFFWYSNHPLSSRLYGTVGIWECIGLGISYGFAGVISLHNIFISSKKHQKYFALLYLIILCIGVLLTQSRLALGAILAGSLILLISQPIKPNIKILLLTSPILLVLIIYFVYPQIFERHFELINQLLFKVNKIPRVIIWESLLTNMHGDLYFGHGYGIKIRNVIPELSHISNSFSTAHSIYIGHLYLGGIVGLILTLTAIGIMGIQSLVYSMSGNNYLSFSLFIFSVLVMSGQYTYLLDHPNEVWINILIPLALCYGLSIKKSEKIPNKS